MPGDKNPKKIKKSNNLVEYKKKTTVEQVGPHHYDTTTKSYGATKKGVVRGSYKKDMFIGDGYTWSAPETYKSMDTTGYSKGKPTYTVKTYYKNAAVYRPFGQTYGSYSEKEIPRSQVKPTIAKMKKGTK